MKRGHSKILEVLVVPNKTNKTGMSLTMPQVCVIYIYIFFDYWKMSYFNSFYYN